MKLRRYTKSIIATVTSLSVLTASLAAFDMGASAEDNKLNIKVYMDEMMCWNFNSICDDVTSGTYGLPTSFTTRLGYITGFSRGYYGYRGINIVFSEFSPSYHLLETSATQCVDASADWTSTMMNGCSCISSESLCEGGTYHCNNLERFVEAIPSYNDDETAVLLLTTSSVCSNGGGEHHYVNGSTNKLNMWIVSRDIDYTKSHGSEETNPYTYARMILAHEIGHLFNVLDHYTVTVLPAKDPDCIWGVNMYDYRIANGGYTCNVCDGTMRDNVNLYNHS